MILVQKSRKYLISEYHYIVSGLNCFQKPEIDSKFTQTKPPEAQNLVIEAQDRLQEPHNQPTGAKNLLQEAQN